MKSQNPTRLTTLDALRGFAAVAVVLFHSRFPGHSEQFQASLPGALRWPFVHGALGVSVFFAISGFVIPLSVDKYRVDGRFIRRFAIKRSLRLDPVYWVVIALAMGPTIFLQVTNLRPNPDREVVTIGELFSNMFYLQGIREIRPFVFAAWTLCLEVQFYLLYVAVLWFVGRFSMQKWPVVARCFERRENLFLFLCVGMSTTILFGISTFPVGWVLIWLPQFGPGVAAFVAYKSVRDKQRLSPLSWMFVVASVLIPLASGLRLHFSGYTASGIAGVVLLVLVLRSRLDLGRNSATIRYFGSRSYSLYLIHGLAMAKAMPIVSRVDSGTAFSQFLVFALSFAVALVSAELLFRCVEQPALRLSRRVPYDGTIRDAFFAAISPRAKSPRPREFRGVAEEKDNDFRNATTLRRAATQSNLESTLSE